MDYPALLIGLTMVAYWARVLRMAFKARGDAHVGNLVPPEFVGKVLRIAWYPVVACWVTYPIIWALARRRRRWLVPAYHISVISWGAAALAVLAFAATWVCWRKMGKSWRMGINPQEKTSLIVTGPYAYVRNPIYALSTILMLATLAAVPTAVMLVVAVAHIALLQWEARREELYLLKKHGPDYAYYRRSVGSFFPRSLKAHTFR